MKKPQREKQYLQILLFFKHLVRKSVTDCTAKLDSCYQAPVRHQQPVLRMKIQEKSSLASNERVSARPPRKHLGGPGFRIYFAKIKQVSRAAVGVKLNKLANINL